MKQILVFAITAVSLIAADATGKWTGTMTVSRPDGSPKAGPALVILKQDGSTLTGTAGPDEGGQRAIEKGKAENGNLTFEVPNGELVMKFQLKQEGDAITGQISRNHEGETQTAKLELRREK